MVSYQVLHLILLTIAVAVQGLPTTPGHHPGLVKRLPPLADCRPPVFYALDWVRPVNRVTCHDGEDPPLVRSVARALGDLARMFTPGQSNESKRTYKATRVEPVQPNRVEERQGPAQTTPPGVSQPKPKPGDVKIDGLGIDPEPNLVKDSPSEDENPPPPKGHHGKKARDEEDTDSDKPMPTRLDPVQPNRVEERDEANTLPPCDLRFDQGVWIKPVLNKTKPTCTPVPS